MEHRLQRVPPPIGAVVQRALRGRCPNCGQGQLFAAYLKQVERCPVCGERYGHIRSDDAAPWLTILIVGIILVPVIFLVESHTNWPVWASITLWPLVVALFALALLPRMKAVLVGLIWLTHAPGSEED